MLMSVFAWKYAYGTGPLNGFPLFDWSAALKRFGTTAVTNNAMLSEFMSKGRFPGGSDAASSRRGLPAGTPGEPGHSQPRTLQTCPVDDACVCPMNH